MGEPQDKLNKKLEEQERQLKEDFKRVFNSPHGKRVYKHILERCHVFHTTFTGSSKTFFLEGERNIGLYLLAMMNLANQEGLEVIKEIDNEY